MTGIVTFPLLEGLDGNNPPSIESVSQRIKLLFDDTTNEYIYKSFRLPDNYASSAVLSIQYVMKTATSGNVVWACEVMCVTPGDTVSIDINSFDTVNSITDAVPGTALYLKEVNIPLTNFDGGQAGDFVTLKIYRDASSGSDTASGLAGIMSADLTFTENAITYTDIPLTNPSFETGDATGWTTTTGSFSVIDYATGDSGTWSTLSAPDVGSPNAYLGFPGTSAYVEAYQDIDISTYQNGGALVYFARIWAMKNFADADQAGIRIELRDGASPSNILASSQVIDSSSVIGAKYVETSIYTVPNAVTARLVLIWDRNAGTNNNCALDNVTLQVGSLY